jgi:integrase
MLVDWFWFSLVLSILLLWLLWHWPQLWPHLQTTTLAAARQRLLKPRTPADCPTCRQVRATAANHPSAHKQTFPANGPVFPSEEGTWIWPRNFTTHYKAVLRRAGLPEETRVHDLRHTMVTTALNNGQPLVVVSKYVGHSSAAITADIYGHRDDSAERKVAESMGAILKQRRTKGES